MTQPFAPDVTGPFREAITEAEKLIAGAEFIRNEQDLAEGFDYLSGCIKASLQMAWAHAKSHPYLVTSTGPYAKMGLDNPDTLYYHANVVPDAEYVITGTRGDTVDLSFQVLKGDYTSTNVPGGDDAFDDRRLQIETDGSFELRFGPPKPDPEPNYFVLGEGSSMLAVREVYNRWDQRKGNIRIERVDTVGTAPDEPGMAQITRRYEIAAKMLLSRINTWFNFPKWFYLDLPVNTLTEPRLTPGGLSTQFSSVGHYELADDEAMLITVPKSDAPYQGFQLGSMWYISLDYVNHQTSLNASQAQVDPDGMIRLVVSTKSPGVANWVETTGRQRGIAQFRWQRVGRTMTASDGPSVSIIDIADVPAHLPYHESNVVTDEQWQERIAERQRGFGQRMLG